MYIYFAIKLHFIANKCKTICNFQARLVRNLGNFSRVPKNCLGFFSREPKLCLENINFYLGNFSRVSRFCLCNLDLPSKLPRVSTLMLHPPQDPNVWPVYDTNTRTRQAPAELSRDSYEIPRNENMYNN